MGIKPLIAESEPYLLDEYLGTKFDIVRSVYDSLPALLTIAGSGGSVDGVLSVAGTAPITSSGGALPAIGITPATTVAPGSMSAADKSKLDAISGVNTGDQELPTTLPASDVYPWAKEAIKPTYTAAEVGAQELLVSGTNIKTVNGTPILGPGDVVIAGGGAVDSVNGQTGVVVLAKADVGLGNADNTSDANKPVSTAQQTALNAKQNTLVSGTTIKTINGISILGSGDIPVDGAGGGVDSVNGYTGVVVLAKTDIGLGNVDNTADSAKPVSTLQAAADTAVQNAAIAASAPIAHVGSGGTAHANAIAAGAAGFMTGADKTKLDGIAAGANNYTHPASHTPDIITQDVNNRFVTDTEKTTWNAKAGTAVATTIANGLMSSTDKTKLDGVADGANNYTHPASHDPAIITQDASNRFVSDTEKSTWNGKQDALVSGTSIKTVNGVTLLGSGNMTIAGTGGGGLAWSVQTASLTSVTNNGYLMDTSAATKTVTLHATPVVGDTVAVGDLKGTFGIYNCTVARNGALIQGQSDDLTLDVKNQRVTLVYSGATDGWVITELEPSPALTGEDMTVSGLPLYGNVKGFGISKTGVNQLTVTKGWCKDSTGLIPLALTADTAVTMPTTVNGKWVLAVVRNITTQVVGVSYYANLAAIVSDVGVTIDAYRPIDYWMNNGSGVLKDGYSKNGMHWWLKASEAAVNSMTAPPANCNTALDLSGYLPDASMVDSVLMGAACSSSPTSVGLGIDGTNTLCWVSGGVGALDTHPAAWSSTSASADNYFIPIISNTIYWGDGGTSSTGNTQLLLHAVKLRR